MLNSRKGHATPRLLSLSTQNITTLSMKSHRLCSSLPVCLHIYAPSLQSTLNKFPNNLKLVMD